jgi:hypothetical protein
MPFDRSTIAPAEQLRLIAIGREFGSSDVRDQANLTLKALETYGPLLAEHGFTLADAKELRNARDAHVQIDLAREQARKDRKVRNAATLEAIKAGKKVRRTARASLLGARRRLAVAGDAEAAREIDGILAHTQRSGADADALAIQLDQLATVLTIEAVRDALPNAAALESSLATHAAAIRAAAAASASQRGTKTETELLDLLDGYIVDLVRAARHAARAAAEATGNPAVSDAFELTALYRSTGRRRKDSEPPSPPVP